jgi:outer membrane immunogenic protein
MRQYVFEGKIVGKTGVQVMRKMSSSKCIAALAFTTAVGAGAASAADLAARPYYTKAPAIYDAVYNWAGFYVGGHVGGSSTNQSWTNTANTTAFGDLDPGQGFRQRGTGVFGGGQMGYNWQASSYVFGLEGTVSAMDNRGSVLNTVFGRGRDDQFSWRTNWMATVTGRVGYAVANNLFYAKGGYAGVNNHLSVVDTVPPKVGSGSATQWHNGWTVGAGWEYGITQNWIVGLEYDYSAFETKSYQLAGAAPGVYAFDAKPRDIQSAVVRLNYKFGGPVVAR